MIKVTYLPSPRAGNHVHSSAQTPTPITTKTDGLARQQAIENALSMALYHVRNGDTTHAIRSATAKAIRAASMLKQACTETAIGGRA